MPTRKPIIETQYVKDDIECVTVLNTDICIRCGYIGVNSDHPFYNKNIEDILISVHGGVTWASRVAPLVETIQDRKDIYWIGFDTGRSRDVLDEATIKKYQLERPLRTGINPRPEEITVWTKECVDMEVELMWQQANITRMEYLNKLLKEGRKFSDAVKTSGIGIHKSRY